MTAVEPAHLQPVIGEYLGRQRWYSGDPAGAAAAAVERVEMLHDGEPAMVQALVASAGSRYQVLLGVRPVHDQPPFLHGHEGSVLGTIDLGGDGGICIAYDAVIDPELALVILDLVAPDQAPATHVRVLAVEQSNTSVVYDDRVIVKVFRRLLEGANPDVEVTQALARVGFDAVAEPLGTWRGHAADLAYAQRYLAGGTDGFALAMTSLRDCYANGCDPAESGGDFAAEAERLGDVTGRLHVALADAFGATAGDAGTWADTMSEQLAAISEESDDWAAPVAGVIDRLRKMEQVGAAIRVHGDFHLAQVMRTDAGWFVLDFEGEPSRPMEQRLTPTSPLKDVGGMLRSFHYATEIALAEREPDEREALADVAQAWEERNRTAFLEGYLAAKGVERLLPDDLTTTDAVLAAFELEKAVYELAYERAHRPDWQAIPLAALARVTRG